MDLKYVSSASLQSLALHSVVKLLRQKLAMFAFIRLHSKCDERNGFGARNMISAKL